MRLADKIIQSIGSASDIGGSVSSLGAAIAEAERFELDDDFALACENLTFSKPSSLAAALPFCRLPFPKVWLEWKSSARGLSEKGEHSEPTKLGCLLEKDDDDPSFVMATWAWFHEDHDYGGVTVCPLGGLMDWEPQSRIPAFLRDAAERLKAGSSSEDIASGQRMLKFVSSEENATSEEVARAMRASDRFAKYSQSEDEIQAYREIGNHVLTVVSKHGLRLFDLMTGGQPDHIKKKLIGIKGWICVS
jgi:hypothetical protein